MNCNLRAALHQTYRTMSTLLQKSPPSSVKSMTSWDPEAFNKTIRVPYVDVGVDFIALFKRHFDKYLLKMPSLQHLLKTEDDGVKRILLDPDLVKTVNDLPEKGVNDLRTCKLLLEDPLQLHECQLTLKNWKPADLLDAVLLDDDREEDGEKSVEGLKSYSIVGHIAHVNLKDHLLPYKSVIGHILLLVKNIRTVVNKTNTIDNTFRNFSMEVLAGETVEDDKDVFVTSVRENGCRFEFDFSKVYWNPRLCTEHRRMVDMLSSGDVLFDVFAGVGPFAVPAAKKGVRVFANDLNPDSFSWLQRNVASNKLDSNKISCSNLDGREFVRTVVKKGLVDQASSRMIHLTMNLPAHAVDFLDAFIGLFSGSEEEEQSFGLPTLHVYTFTKNESDPAGDVKFRCESVLNCSLDDAKISFVRKVAPSKDMFRATFQVPREVLIGRMRKSEDDRKEDTKRSKLQ